jgi:hypothetical protein
MEQKKDNKFEWYASGNAPLLYPTELYLGDFIFEDGTKLYIPESHPFATSWGKSISTYILDDNMHCVPIFIVIAWYSILENQFYVVANELPKHKIKDLFLKINNTTKESIYNSIIAGMAPYGGLAIWLSGNGITTEVAWLHGEKIDVEMKDFAPHYSGSRDEYVKSVLENCKEACENFQKNGLPDKMLFERYMTKFNYCITPKFEDEEATFDGIELWYFNGEYNATHSGEHAICTMRAKPYKIVINWSVGKHKYGGYFWTDEQKIIDTFAQFYADNAQQEGNLIIEIGKSNEAFRFSLQSDSSIVEIPIEDLQIMVFKNKFESYRSKNYNKPQGGWRN